MVPRLRRGRLAGRALSHPYVLRGQNRQPKGVVRGSFEIQISFLTRLVLVETLGGIAPPTKQFLHVFANEAAGSKTDRTEYGAASD